jgi:hypothetical protein
MPILLGRWDRQCTNWTNCDTIQRSGFNCRHRIFLDSGSGQFRQYLIVAAFSHRCLHGVEDLSAVPSITLSLQFLHRRSVQTDDQSRHGNVRYHCRRPFVLIDLNDGFGVSLPLRGLRAFSCTRSSIFDRKLPLSPHLCSKTASEPSSVLENCLKPSSLLENSL